MAKGTNNKTTNGKDYTKEITDLKTSLETVGADVKTSLDTLNSYFEDGGNVSEKIGQINEILNKITNRSPFTRLFGGGKGEEKSYWEKRDVRDVVIGVDDIYGELRDGNKYLEKSSEFLEKIYNHIDNLSAHTAANQSAVGNSLIPKATTDDIHTIANEIQAISKLMSANLGTSFSGVNMGSTPQEIGTFLADIENEKRKRVKDTKKSEIAQELADWNSKTRRERKQEIKDRRKERDLENAKNGRKTSSYYKI